MPKKIEEKLNPLTQGYADRYMGKDLKTNPYPKADNYNSDSHKWERGWYEAHYEISSKTH